MAEMNALVVRDAEEYYRLMMTEDAVTWNLRYVFVSSWPISTTLSMMSITATTISPVFSFR